MKRDDKALKQAIREHFALDDRTQWLIGVANADLMWGPYERGWTEDDVNIYPGFSSAVDEIQKAMPTIREVWVYDDGNVDEVEPHEEEIDGEWYEPFWEEITKVSVREVKEILFGKELSEYL